MASLGICAFGFVCAPWLRGLVFAHSVGYRQPLRRCCPACGFDTVDVALRGLFATAPPDGRCPSCQSPVGPTPGSAELASVAVLAALAYAAPSTWLLVAWSWTALFGISLAFVDVAVLRLPDALTIAAGLGSLVFLIVAAVATESLGNLAWAVIGALGLGALYLLPILSRAMGMGRGDGMLAVVVGLNVGWLGLDALVTATVMAAVIAVGYVVAMLARRRLRPTDHVAVGPFILIGALVAVVLHAV